MPSSDSAAKYGDPTSSTALHSPAASPTGLTHDSATTHGDPAASQVLSSPISPAHPAVNETEHHHHTIGTQSLLACGPPPSYMNGPVALADLSVAAKARHSIWHAGVISSPFQHEGTRKPAAVHPGHLLQTIQYLSGHSKTRWVRDGNAAAMLHWQDLPTGGEARPKLLPTMSWDKGLATKGVNV